MKTRLLIIIGILMMATIPFVTFAVLDRYSDYVEHVGAMDDKEDKSPKLGDKYYIEPERKEKLEAVELDLRDKITQLHQQKSLSSFGVNLDHRTQEVIVIVEKDHFNAEIEKMISEYPDDIQIVFFNDGIYLDEWSESEPVSKLEPETDSEIDSNCMTLEQSKAVAPFFKTPTYLPEGYSSVCSQSGTPFESYIVYHNQEILNWNIPELISDGAIFIYQIDERRILDEEKLEILGTSEQRIQEDYDGVMRENPSLQPQLIRINGMLAYAVDSCPNCGMQTANYTDGTFVQKFTSTETKIKFIDENGINYMLKTALPLDELILVAESLQ